jgi:hypothetical protein
VGNAKIEAKSIGYSKLGINLNSTQIKSYPIAGQIQVPYMLDSYVTAGMFILPLFAEQPMGRLQPAESVHLNQKKNGSNKSGVS